jgi:hypothetical protein
VRAVSPLGTARKASGKGTFAEDLKGVDAVREGPFIERAQQVQRP